MKTTLDDLKTRRSCKGYKPDPVPQELLDAILEAGTYAPTGKGRQSPIIVAVRDKATRDKLSAMNAAVMGVDTDPFYGAPVVLVVLAQRDWFTAVYDGSCVMCNLLNAAHALGVGSCWIHRAREVFDSEEGKALLRSWGVQGDYVGVGHCVLGYPAKEPAAPAPRKENYIIRVD